MNLQKIYLFPLLVSLMALAACGDSSVKSKANKVKAKEKISAADRVEKAKAIADQINQIVDKEVSAGAQAEPAQSRETVRSNIAEKVQKLQKDKNISDLDFLRGILFLSQQSVFEFVLRNQYLGESRDFYLPLDEKIVEGLINDLDQISNPETGELAVAMRSNGQRSLSDVQLEYQKLNRESQANFLAMRGLGYEPTNETWESSEKKSKNQSKVNQLLKREREIDQLLENNDEDFGRADAANMGQDPLSVAQKRAQALRTKLSLMVTDYQNRIAAEKAAEEADRAKREEELRKSAFPY